MTDYPLDIIIPIWNRPVEVRESLASFVAASPMARLVMVNIGSERETEVILDEFAEALDDQALLIATERNIGSVAALNYGFSRSSAPFILLTTPFTRLNEGWFDQVMTLFERYPEAGAVVLQKSDKKAPVDGIEADHGSFDAMVLKRALYETAGGFDESMDGSEWTLRDYARRTLAHGYRTFSLLSRHLEVFKYSELGSAVRREDRGRLARQTYTGRWGEQQNFLLICSDNLFGVDPDMFRIALLESARQGDSLIVAAERKVAKVLSAEIFSVLHENISFQLLPRFFSRKVLAGIVSKAGLAEPSTLVICETDCLSHDLKRSSFPELLATLQQRKELYYQRGVHD